MMITKPRPVEIDFERTKRGSRIEHPEYLTVIEGEHSLIMHNFPPDTKGRWVSRDNGDGTSSFTYELYPNRAQKRQLRRR